jgi:hypothetical protein
VIICEIQSTIEAVERNEALFEETNFTSRAEALDLLDFHVIDRVEALLQTLPSPTELLLLKQYAENVRHQLEAVDKAMFQRLRANIRMGSCRGATLLDLITTYVGYCASSRQASPIIGYDTLDVFTNGLFPVQPLPLEIREREPEMVYYQKTPARIILELVEKARLTDQDVFYDLGSGLGHVPILVNLLSEATAKGIEVEPAYCTYANVCVADLNLSKVVFYQGDALQADYSQGTVFFLYTPFEGRMLQEVLERLQAEAQIRRITLFTYGPCTLHISQQEWLKCADPEGPHLYKLGEFKSLPM